jgi:hypothetical protein
VKDVGVQRTIITHPLSIGVGPTATIDEQKRMKAKGVFFEHCFTACMPHSDQLKPIKIADAIREIGPDQCILSTDFGQITNPPPAEGMRMYIEVMKHFGIEEKDILTMIKTNPAKVLNLQF